MQLLRRQRDAAERMNEQWQPPKASPRDADQKGRAGFAGATA